MIDFKFYSGKKVLITGNTGFKGTWLTAILLHLGAEVIGVASFRGKVNPTFLASGYEQKIKQYRVDIRDDQKLEKVISKEKPRLIFHLAAQALTLRGIRDPLTTFQVNVLGTVNLLEVVRKTRLACTVVVATSDKSYENKEWYWSYRESDRLFGSDPYGASKSMAENAVRAYYQAFFSDSQRVKVCTVRAGNVFGGGDWSEDRLVPDCIRAWSENRQIEIRSPDATRPWSYVLDVLLGYLQACKALVEQDGLNGESYNFGPDNHSNLSVMEFVERMWKHYNQEEPLVPTQNLADAASNKEHKQLQLSSEKARKVLGWRPRFSVYESTQATVDWYQKFLIDKSLATYLLDRQVTEYFLRVK